MINQEATNNVEPYYCALTAATTYAGHSQSCLLAHYPLLRDVARSANNSRLIEVYIKSLVLVYNKHLTVNQNICIYSSCYILQLNSHSRDG